MSDWNDKVIAEFRANGGRVGDAFAGAPLLLLHHAGRSSGTPYIAPIMYQAGAGDTVYVFASKGGAPDDPDWYANAVAAGKATVEIGTQTFEVTVEELTGEQRDAVYARQAAAYPGFAEYEEKTRGVRTIPVLALTRA
ncbi:MAG: ddn 2 [Frankiales bacterium]|jgi:deazaflavin-dependent oxidoreductase (nitroreductase family)|nr:ddn 2 [Frankiales bacterium]